MRPNRLGLLMPKRILGFILLAFLGITSCKQRDVFVPSYIHLKPVVLTSNNQDVQGYPSAKVEDVFVFSNGTTRGLFAIGADVPLQNTGKTNIRISPAIKYNGYGEQKAIYPMFNFFEKDIDLTENKVDSVQPVFTYVENAFFPFVEDYDGNGVQFEYNPQFKLNGDTIIKDNSDKAWLPGKNSGRVQMGSGASSENILEVYSKVFTNWPTYTDFYLEMDYKGNIPITVGLYATNAQFETSRVKMYITNPKEDWNKLYLDLQPEINSRGSNIQYRLFISFNRADVVNPEAWIDNIKIIYLD